MADQPKLGVLIDASAQRDAIHIAIAPVVAAEELAPGERIGFVSEDREKVGTSSGDHIGIVDPFLNVSVAEGQRFWMFLLPQTITSLRHEWTHPAFGPVATVVAETEQAKSERWLRVFAEEVGVSYRILMDAAANWLSGEQRKATRAGGWNDNYHTLSYDTPDVVHTQKEEMWKHYEIVAGVKVENHGATFFSCSCS